MRRQSTLAMAIALLLAGAVPASAAPKNLCNVPIAMSDGMTLRGNVFLPAETGRFPVIVTVTGYNKDATNPFGTECSMSGALATGDPALLEAGYAVMLVDDRGTGASEGQWDSWGERTQADYPEVLDWIVAQPWSDGSVGMTGGSYMGISSLLVAEADAARVKAGKPRAVKAVWADVPMADAYRDVTFHGGASDIGFIPLWLGLVNALNDLPPSNTLQEPGTAAPAWVQHITGSASFAGTRVAEATLGQASAYDGPFYRLRSPGERAASLEIPVAWTGGWFDIFQRGEPLLYELLKNVPSKKFWMTPTYHAAGRNTFDEQKIGSGSQVRLRWFDRWIKGKQNGVEELAPVNLYTMGSDRWQHLPDWPVPGTVYTPFHLSGTSSGSSSSMNDGSLELPLPAAAGDDLAPLLPLSSPCSRLTMQWTAGLAALGSCETDNRTFEASALTYSTAALEKDIEVTGPITANLWATLSTPNATLVAILSDVVPGGASTQISGGFLLASQRAIDAERSTRSGGRIVRPYHPFTQESEKPVTPGQPELYRIEIYPTSNVFKAGHRIRLTLGSANTPTTGTSVPGTLAAAGGTISLLRGGKHDSHLLLPVIDPSRSAAGVVDLPARRCASRRNFLIRVKRNRGTRIRSVTVQVNGKRVKVLRGSRLRARVRLTGLPRGTYRVRIVVRGTRAGKPITLRDTRTYRTCRKRR